MSDAFCASSMGIDRRNTDRSFPSRGRNQPTRDCQKQNTPRPIAFVDWRLFKVVQNATLQMPHVLKPHGYKQRR